MRLSELFESDENDIQTAMLSYADEIQSAGANMGTAISHGLKMMRPPFNKNSDDAASIGKKYAISMAKQSKPKTTTDPELTKPNVTSQTPRDRVKRSITVPDADRTRQDTLGRNLKADRYYQELNKTPRGRDLIKKAAQSLGLPPTADAVIDKIADEVPSVIKDIEAKVTNPSANIKSRQASNQAK